MTYKNPYLKTRFKPVVCCDCGVHFEMMQRRKSARCDECTMRRNSEYRFRRSSDDEGVAYQDEA